MSGHPRFANIKHKKERGDIAKDKVFAVAGRGITVAVKEDGADPANNSKSRNVIAKAKANNMSNDTIDRGIKRAAGDTNSVNYETLTYEGYDPNGVVIIANTLTDSKNRAVANVRSAFTRSGGNVDAPRSMSYMFDKKGQAIIDREECGMDPDGLMMFALDAGAEDFSEEKGSYKVVTAPEDFSAVRKALEAQSIPMMQTDVTMIPRTWVELTDEDDIKKLNRILDSLDKDGDVRAMYHNWDE